MTKVVVIIGFLVSFAAGLVVGIGTKNLPDPKGSPAGSPTSAPSTHPSGRGVLPMALNLTPEQQEKMKKIWSSGPPHGHNGDDPRRAARDERDAAIVALMTPEQKTKYDEVQKQYQDRLTAMDQEFREDFQRKVKETDEILSPEQSAKYHEFLNRHQPFEHGPHDHGDRGFRDNRRGDDRATSQPRSQP
jgi:Spy/CpxP family protein refolding chaperone